MRGLMSLTGLYTLVRGKERTPFVRKEDIKFLVYRKGQFPPTHLDTFELPLEFMEINE